jgi:hypothetical protein
MELAPLGRLLTFAGITLAIVGLALVFADRVPLLGRLPGDLTLRGERWAVYLPIATSIVIGLALTLALTLFAVLGRR